MRIDGLHNFRDTGAITAGRDELAALADVTKQILPDGAAPSPEAIEQALTWVDDNHSGAAEYLLSGGLTDQELTELRSRLAG